MAISDDFPKILTSTWGNPDAWKYEAYAEAGGYTALKKALKDLKPEEVVNEVKTSGLRGRGGAGFSTGQKWSFVPKDSKKPKYVTINADEGEPGTYKDRELLGRDANRMIEGALITAYAVGSHDIYVYVRGEFFRELEKVKYAIDQAYQHGHAGKNVHGSGWDVEIRWTKGAGAYICGEETGMHTSLEGGKGWPKLKPPFPPC